MHEIQHVAVLGAGAMGAYFAAQFFQAPGFSTNLIARGRRYERLRTHGLTINGVHHAISISHPDRVADPADLIIVALKHHHLPGALPDLANFIHPNTTIVSIMNGLDSEKLIGAEYGMEKLLYTVSVGIDALREGDQIVYTQPGIHYFGEEGNPSLSPRVKRVQQAFDQAGIAHKTPPDMVRMLWWKFMINVGMNQASAVTRAPYGDIPKHARCPGADAGIDGRGDRPGRSCRGKFGGR